ncbi:MAG: GTPase [Marvinbryantia sp.]|jgi:small GTP-binding protein
MKLRNIDSIGVVGYLIVANQEIHSNQIRWLENKWKINNDEYQSSVIKNILDDKEEKVAYNKAIVSFGQEPEKMQENIYELCYQLAMIDNDSSSNFAIDSMEKSILRELEHYMKSNNPSTIARIKRNAIKRVKDCGFELSFKQNQGAISEFDSKKILSIANSDYKNYRNVFKKIWAACDNLKNELENADASERNKQIKDAIEEFLTGFKNKTLHSLSELNQNLEQKELAVNSISIALMGRTKAGKSTLHYVMCQEGKDFIGKGSQRTTRYNRVFSWNGLKIIDTPGIGAGEQEGKKDENIALKVLSYADLICFVIIDDTIQDDVLGLLDRVAEYNKPILVVLNHKDNICRKSHMRTFLNNPDDWKTNQGESSLIGYKNRLQRHAEKNGYSSSLMIVPVFLLAAQLGIEQKNDKLYKASNYTAFIDAIKKLLRDNGLIYKSKTILEEPGIRLFKALKSIEREEDDLKKLYDQMNEISRQTQNSFDKSTEGIIEECKKICADEVDVFFDHNKWKFIENNSKIKDKEEFLSAFKKCIKQDGIEKRIENKINDFIQQKGRELINEEIDREISYTELNIHNKKYSAGEKDVALKTMKISDGDAAFVLKEIAGTMINYMILDGGNVFILALQTAAGWYKHNKKKHNTEQQITYDNFQRCSQIYKEKIQNKIEDGVKDVIKKDKRSIGSFYDDCKHRIDEARKSICKCKETFAEGTHKIDQLFANRILDYLFDEYEYINVVDVFRSDINGDLHVLIDKQLSSLKYDKRKYKAMYNRGIKIQSTVTWQAHQLT